MRRTARRVSANPPGRGVLGRDDDEGDDDTLRSYGGLRLRRGHPTTNSVAAVVGLLWCATIIGEHAARLAPWRGVVVFAAVVAAAWCRRLVVHVALAIACGMVGGASAWHSGARPVNGECGGVARLVKDPAGVGRGISTVLEIDGIRYATIAHGRLAGRLSARLAGESVRVEGTCGPITGRSARWNRINHVVGAFTPSFVSEEYSTGSMAARASNRLRQAISRGVHSMSPTSRSLFMGLVIGDDRDQPRSMIVEFRRSGLSHLCAVSGQNVAYLLAAMAPLLRRRRRHVRWLLTMGIIAWFTMLTRGEPSVLRAGAMAALVATNAAVGVAVNARLVLCATVATLLLVDPMLAWSVGFALSVGATAGLAWVSASFTRVVRVPVLGRRVRGIDAVVASTLAAQIGTMPVSLAIFGSVPVVSVATNPLAIGVAGGVMMLGLPIALVSSVLPAIEPLVSFVLSVPVVWVGAVARVGSAVGPRGAWNALAWLVVAAWVTAALRRSNAKRDSGITDVGT